MKNKKIKKIIRFSILGLPIIITPLLISCSKIEENNLQNYFENVVEIKITKNNQDLSFATGTIYQNKIISNHHILPRNSENKNIEYWYRKFDSNDFIKMNYIKSSKEKDLALFESKDLNKGFEINKNYILGEKVYTIGNSLNMGLAISEGIISTVNYFDENKYIRVYGQIEEGNSGGPLFNKYGQIIGIVSFKNKINLSETVNSFYFVIPFNDVLNFLNN
ncbi:trypsin-like peptidase domain-containing protein [Candidatus Mycoplasma pogonae]